MYIIFDETIIDSEEIKDLIQQKSDFKVEKDMCKATKREDVLAYLVTLDVDLIEKQIREEYDLQDMEMEDLFEEYMELAEEKALELEELMPMESSIHPFSVKTYLRYIKYYKNIDFAKYTDENYDYDELNNIEVPLFMRW